MHHYIKIVLIAFLTWVGFIASIPLVTSTNSSFPLALPIDDHDLNAEGAARCTEAQTWKTSRFRPDDCTEALRKLQMSSLRYGSSTVYRFYDNRNPIPKGPGPIAFPTPFEYNGGTCTLVIALLEIFEEHPLPQMYDGPFPDREETTLGIAEMAAARFLRVCVPPLRQGHPGWIGFGK